MKIGNVWIIFRKEFLDVLRDRRTLLSMILLPIVIFPLLISGLGSFAAGQMEKIENRSSPVVVIGGEGAPDLLTALQHNEGLQIITTISDSAVVSEMLMDHVVQAVLYISPDFDLSVGNGQQGESSQQILIWYDKSRTESELVMKKVRTVLSAYRESLVQRNLEEEGLPQSFLEPFRIETQNRASESQMAGALLGMLLPYIVILLAVVGSTYSAIDLTAGEKERGTMETLLVCPASRLELVLGKFFTTMIVSTVTALLAVVSMSLTFMVPGSIMSQGMGSAWGGALNPITFGIVILLMLPVTALFAAVLIAIAVNARSYKEAQSYVYPVIILSIFPAIASMMPGFEADLKMALIPVLNVSLILRDAFMGIYNVNIICLTFASSVVYAAGAIFIAVRVFQKESVLLRI